MALSNIALTINAMRNYASNNEVAIDVKGGAHYNHLRSPKPTARGEFWIVIFDRRDLTVKENFMFSDNSKVPSQLAPYKGDTNYFYVFSTQNINSDSIPTGALYQWLVSEGAGKELKSIEQACGALNCSSWSGVAYVFVDVFGPKDISSIEFSCLIGAHFISTLELMPADIGGTTYYVPVALG